MITIAFGEIKFKLTDKNESEVKESLRILPLNSEVTILETGEVLKINDIFNYEQSI